MNFSCPVFYRGTAEYEIARRNAVWNGKKPGRYPEIIVQARNADDVIMAVRYAESHGMKIGVRSGGHSWTASFLRQDGMLIEVSQLNEITVDADSGTATAGPGVHGGELNDKLKAHGYMFPGGHCPTVALGGYLLQGGFGWNSRKYGLAVESVLAVDVVTADGNLVHASPNEHQGLYWAARGSGHGFFGVIVRFYLQCHPLPRAIINSRLWLTIDCLSEIIACLDDVYTSFPRHLEVSLIIGHNQDGISGPTICVRADSLGMTESEARKALEILHGLPVMTKAVKTDLFKNLDLAVLLEDIGDLLEVNDHEYVVDNTWIDQPLKTILPELKNMVDALSPAPSHLYILYWDGAHLRLPDMAFSLSGTYYISYFCIYKDPNDHDRSSKLVTDVIAAIADKGCGSQLGDENLSKRPSTRFMDSANFARLECLRRNYDPAGRFHGYMALNEEFEAISSREHSSL